MTPTSAITAIGYRGLITLLVCCGIAASSRAYQPPLEEIVLNSGAPSAPYDVLKFSPDGSQLRAAGEDKHIWQFDFNGGRISSTPPTLARWPMFRDQKGMIYSIGLASEGKSTVMAVAGYGLTVGNLAVIDSKSGKLLKGLPAQIPVCVVWSTCFSPDGAKIAFGDDLGNVRLWSWRDGTTASLIGRHSRKNQDPVRVIQVEFLSDSRLLSVGGDGTVQEWDLARRDASAVRSAQFSRLGKVHRALVSQDKQWVVATGTEEEARTSSFIWHLHVMNLDTLEIHTIPFPKYVSPLQFALDWSSRRVAVCTSEPSEARTRVAGIRYKPVLSNTIYLCDLVDRSRAPVRLGYQSNYDIDALAFHPQGEYLAVAGGENYELVILNLKTQQVVDKVEQRGKGVWQIAFSADGRSMGLRDHRNPDPDGYNNWGMGDWNVFNLRATRSTELGWSKTAATFAPVLPNNKSQDGWEIVPDDRSNFIWNVKSPQGQLFRLPLNVQIDQQPRCYSFINVQQGHAPRLLVGHYLGATLFELDPHVGPKVARIFVGHTGHVTSLSVSPDERSFITSSRDGTIAAYSLLPWPSQEILGASFLIQGNKLVLRQIDPGSPLWEAALLQGIRLNPGDTVDSFQFDGHQIYDPEGIGARRFESFQSNNAIRLTVTEALKRLEKPVSRHEYFFHLAGKGWIVTTARQMPRWKLFAARNAASGRLNGGEWILWRWMDHYYATSTHGDELIGWQITRGLEKTPLFFPAERFRRRFDRPAKVHELLENLNAAPDWMTFVDLVPPGIELAKNSRASEQFREKLIYDITIKPREETIPEASVPEQVTVWLNDQKLEDASRALQPVLNQTQQVAIPRSLLRKGVDNILTVKLYGKQQTRNEEAIVIPNTEPPSRKAKLYGFLFGVSDYSQCKPVPQENLCSERSLELVEQWLLGQKGNELYEDVIVERVPEREASLMRFRSSLRALAAKVGPDDVVIVMLAGHGIGGRKIDELIKPEAWSGQEKSKYLFLLGNFDVSRPIETSLSDKVITDELSAVPGYKIVLMDACHASAGFDIMRGLTPENVGPTIIASCAPEEVSWESPALGMGFFTMALVNSTDRKVLQRFGRDNKLRAEDLAKFLEVQVPDVLKRWNPNKKQTPMFEQSRPNGLSKFLLATPASDKP